MKLGKLIVGIGIGTVIGMLCAPKKGSELRKDIKDKSKDLYDKAQNISKEDIQELINNTIDEIKLAIDEFDADEFKENAGKKINEVKSKLEELAVSVKPRPRLPAGGGRRRDGLRGRHHRRPRPLRHRGRRGAPLGHRTAAPRVPLERGNGRCERIRA